MRSRTVEDRKCVTGKMDFKTDHLKVNTKYRVKSTMEEVLRKGLVRVRRFSEI